MKHRESLVTWGKWCVSTCNPPMRGGSGYQLSVFRCHNSNGHMGLPLSQGGCKFQYGFGNGRIFATKEQADRFCLEHGYLQRYYASPDLRKRRMIDGLRRRAEANVARMISKGWTKRDFAQALARTLRMA